MPRIVYDTATSINGFIADEENSLDWLFAVPTDGALLDRLAPPDSPVVVMGSTTYEWLLYEEDLLASPNKWQQFYADRAVYVFTTRDLPTPDGAKVAFLSGPVAQHVPMLRAGGDVWLVGGGDLAGQFLDADALDEIRVTVAPVFLAGGAPLLPRVVRSDRLRLVSAEMVGPFARLVYATR
jgi:dihydrofolate reductase